MPSYTKEEYNKYAEHKSPKSPLLRDMLCAFLIGGAICALGQVLLDVYQKLGLSKDVASITMSISLVALSGILTAFNVYDNIAKVAGAGTLVPITGFANSVVSPAMEFKFEGYVLGVGAKMFSIAGPVLVYGSLTSMVAGLIYYLWKVV